VWRGSIRLVAPASGDIPAEASRYLLGSRSALEWLIDRCRAKTDKESGIMNDRFDWCREHGNPRYIVDLLKRITGVSVETMKIVDSVPELPLWPARRLDYDAVGLLNKERDRDVR
jgi:Type ISP C-terminal specificity domain